MTPPDLTRKFLRLEVDPPGGPTEGLFEMGRPGALGFVLHDPTDPETDPNPESIRLIWEALSALGLQQVTFATSDDPLTLTSGQGLETFARAFDQPDAPWWLGAQCIFLSHADGNEVAVEAAAPWFVDRAEEPLVLPARVSVILRAGHEGLFAAYGESPALRDLLMAGLAAQFETDGFEIRREALFLARQDVV